MSKQITTIKYQMSVVNDRSSIPWTEDLSKNSMFNAPSSDADAVRIANDTITFFNSTLRRGESLRKLVGVKKIEIITTNLINS